jgi:hypothetical protein
VEVNPTALARHGNTCAELVRHFAPDDFECVLRPHFAIDGRRHLPARPLTPDETFTDAWFYNLIALPRAPGSAARRRRIEPILQRGARS